jgi:hypothetical protein
MEYVQVFVVPPDFIGPGELGGHLSESVFWALIFGLPE